MSQITTATLDIERNVTDRLSTSAPEVAAKIEQLSHLRDVAYAKLQSASDRETTAKEEMRIIQRRLDELRDQPRGIESDETQEAFNRAQAARDRVERAHAIKERASADWHQLAGLETSVCRYIQQLPPNAEIMAELLAPAKLKKGESYIDAIARLRTALESINNNVLEIKAAPIPSEKAKQIATAYVRELANEGRPDVSMLLKHGGSLRWPNQPLPGVNVDGMIPQLAKTLPIIAWMHADALLEAILREIDSAATNDEMSLSDSDRALRLAELAEARLKLEREEESLISQAAEVGVEIVRRRSADPRAVLGLSSSMPVFKK